VAWQVVQITSSASKSRSWAGSSRMSGTSGQLKDLHTHTMVNLKVQQQHINAGDVMAIT
jgi:hypothetical protein